MEPLSADELRAANARFDRARRMILAESMTPELIADIRAEAAERVAQWDAEEAEDPTPPGQGRAGPKVLLSAHHVVALCDAALGK